MGRPASGTSISSRRTSRISNWSHPDVRREHEEILRFWFDRGVAGVRIDSAALLVKDPALPEVPVDPAAGQPSDGRPRRAPRHLPELASDRRLVPGQADPRRRDLAARTWTDSPATCAPTSSTPPSISTSSGVLGRPPACGNRSMPRIAAHAPVGAASTWVLSNHDVTRPVTRLGREDSSFAFATKRHGTPTDLELGRRRARAAALLSAALPGSLYIYQGDELGLDEVDDLPRRPPPGPDVLPIRRHRSRSRRLPGSAAVVGWRAAVRLQPRPLARASPGCPSRRTGPISPSMPRTTRPSSMLNLYRAALRIRRAEPGLGDGPMTWLPSDPRRSRVPPRRRFVNLTNLSAVDIALPLHADDPAGKRRRSSMAACRRTPQRWLRTWPPEPVDRDEGVEDAVTSHKRCLRSVAYHVPVRERLPRHTSMEERKE